MTGINKNQKFHKGFLEFTEYVYEHEDLLPHRYVFVLTNKCNLKCSFCFQDKKTISSNMKLADWLKVLEQIPSNSRITLTGGEPFIFPDFLELFEKVATKVQCNIISNGLLLTNDLIDEILKYDNFKVLSISIDNIGNTVRDVTSKQWQELEEKLSYFVKRKKELGSSCVLDIKTTVLDENTSKLFDIYKYCVEKLKCDTHGFQFLKGSPLQHSDKIYEFDKIFEKSTAYKYKNFDNIKQQLLLVQEYNILNHQKSFLHPKVGSLIVKDNLMKLDYLNSEEMIVSNFKVCKFPWSSVHINYDGNLCPCLSVSMGNVKDKSLNDIIFSKEFIKFKKTIKEKGLVEGCNRCGWLQPI